MSKKTSIFGNMPYIPEDPKQSHYHNIFENDYKRVHPSYINQNMNSQQKEKKRKEINYFNNPRKNNKNDINPKTFVNKPYDMLKASINLNLFPDEESNNETNSTTNNKNDVNNINNNQNPNSSLENNNNININNNLNANTQIKTQFHNKINKDNNSIPAIKEENKINNKGNIINENKDNNNKNTDSKNKKPNAKEKKNIFKSVMVPNEINNDNKENKENKVKNKKKEKIDLKKQKENEKNKAEIMDKLKCYICIDKLKKPRMCKYCHRPACDNCLKMWLNEKHQCGFCRKRINYNETIEIPIINDIADFFMKSINNQKEEVNNKKNDNKNEQKSFESEIYDSYSEISKLKLKEEDNLCQKHKNKYEYFCYQCNEKYCDKCLVICNNSSKIHENHLIIPLDQIEKNNSKINEAMEEFQKLKQTNVEIDNLIKLYELKIRELEIEKNNFISEIELVKEEIIKKINNNIYNLSTNYNTIKSKNDEFANSIDTTPLALQNLIKFKDHGQGKQIYEHLLSLNKYALDNNFIDLNQEKLYIETFVSNVIEINIPKEANPKLNINEQINNLIPNYDMNVTFENIEQNIRLKINLNKKLNINFEKEKILCFIIFKNKKYGCEFIKMKQQYNQINKICLYSSISSNVFFSFKDENNKISYKLYFMVYKS